MTFLLIHLIAEFNIIHLFGTENVATYYVYSAHNHDSRNNN